MTRATTQAAPNLALAMYSRGYTTYGYVQSDFAICRDTPRLADTLLTSSLRDMSIYLKPNDRPLPA